MRRRMAGTPVFPNLLELKLSRSCEQHYGRVAKGVRKSRSMFMMAPQKLSLLLPECCCFVICVR